MLVMLLIGWIVLLPAIVVAGLYVGSSVLSRRRAALHAYEDLLADEDALDSPFEHEPAGPSLVTPLHDRGRPVDRALPVVDETPPVAARS